MVHEPPDRLFGQRPARILEPAAALRREVGGEERDVFAAVAEWRNAEVHGVEPKEKVFPKPARRNFTVEVAVGGRDHLHVDFDRPSRAHGHHLPQLKSPEEFRLDLERQFADLVEEEDAPVRGPEGADRGIVGAGEGALLVAEEQALGEG